MTAADSRQVRRSQGGTKVGIDVSTGVRFSLTGRQLTVNVLSRRRP